MEFSIKAEPFDEEFTGTDSTHNWSTTSPRLASVDDIPNDTIVNTQPAFFVKLEEIKTEANQEEFSSENTFIKAECSNSSTDHTTANDDNIAAEKSMSNERIKNNRPDHPPISSMIKTAITSLNEHKGSSLYAIKKHIYTVQLKDIKNIKRRSKNAHIRRALKFAVDNNLLVQSKCSYKLNTSTEPNRMKRKLKIKKSKEKMKNEKTKSKSEKAEENEESEDHIDSIQASVESSSYEKSSASTSNDDAIFLEIPFTWLKEQIDLYRCRKKTTHDFCSDLFKNIVQQFGNGMDILWTDRIFNYLKTRVITQSNRRKQANKGGSQSKQYQKWLNDNKNNNWSMVIYKYELKTIDNQSEWKTNIIKEKKII